MTKEEYIGKLRSKLGFFLSSQEICDISEDMSEVFAEGMAEGRSESDICASLGSPADAARDILAEHGISPKTGRTLAKTVAFAVISAAALGFLWGNTYDSTFIMPLVPVGLLLMLEEGKLSHLTEKKPSALSLIAVIFSALGVFLFAKLADAVLNGNEAALFPLSAVLTAAAAVSLICAVLSVRVSRFGAAVPICGGLISAVIIGFMAYSSFHITEQFYTDADMSYELMQIMYRSKFLNIFMMTLFASAAFVFVTLGIRRDRLTLPCMYAVMGVMMILSKERGILRSLDPSMPLKSIINYIPLSLIIAAVGTVILSAAADIYLIRRKAG